MDLRRYIPILQVGMPLFGILAACNLAAARAFGRIPAWTSEAPQWLVQSEINSGSRAAGIAHAMASQKLKTLNLVLGQSTAFNDLDCQELERQCGVPTRWFTIGGAGNSFFKMENAVQPVFYGELHPHVCLLVIDPTDLIGYPMYIKVPGKTTPVEADAFNWRSESSVWMFSNKDYANRIIQSAYDKARERIMGKIGLPLEVVYEPDRDPTRTPFPYSGKARPETMALAMENFARLRYFRPESYRSDSFQALAFLKLVAECRHIGAKVVVMIAPESEAVRSRMPPAAMLCLKQVLDKAKQGGDLAVFNMQDAAPETSMYDFMHVHQEDRKNFTDVFIRRMKSVSGPNYCSDY